MMRCSINQLAVQTVGDCTPQPEDILEAKKIMQHRVPSKASIFKKLVTLYGTREEIGGAKRQRAVQRLAQYEKSEIKAAKNDCSRDNQSHESVLLEATEIRKALNQYIGLDAVYVGRPYHQGYRVPSLKKGSSLANPFSLKTCDGSIEQVLTNYGTYIKTRLLSSSKTDLISRLLQDNIVLPDRPHLQLDIVGDDFRQVLEDHQSKNLVCTCKLTDKCHVDIIMALK
jgi:hypothetical protein